jgi:LacI family transcriptional regulator
MKGDKRTSPNKIYDVAGAAGVSLATVSRVLNHPEKVKPATREKIEKIIKELGYKPNLNAKGLASSKSTTVGVVVPELTRSSISKMVDGIAATAVRRGYLIRLFVNDSSSAEDHVAAERELWRTVISSGVDGILYINDEIAEEYQGKAIVRKVDVEESPTLSGKYKIRNVPTVLFIKNGEVKDKSVGAVPKAKLVEKLEALM